MSKIKLVTKHKTKEKLQIGLRDLPFDVAWKDIGKLCISRDLKLCAVQKYYEEKSLPREHIEKISRHVALLCRAHPTHLASVERRRDHRSERRSGDVLVLVEDVDRILPSSMATYSTSQIPSPWSPHLISASLEPSIVSPRFPMRNVDFFSVFPAGRVVLVFSVWLFRLLNKKVCIFYFCYSVF